jgi:putative transcriptional regulator
MATVRRSNEEIRHNPGKVDWEKLRATTEADIQRYIQEDAEEGDGEFDFSDAQLVISPAYIRQLRKKLRLTRAAFAKRFALSERTIEEWERGRQAPTGPARVLLRVIEREPEAVERALKVS